MKAPKPIYIRSAAGDHRFVTALKPFGARFRWVAIYFAALILAGTAGYVILEGWSVLDALYMASITASAVGYGEVHPLSSGGRVFTIVLMAASIIGLGILWALITALFVELDLAGLLRRRRIMRKIEELSDHFIVCGAGRMGRVVIKEMKHAQVPFVAIDVNPSRLAALTELDNNLLVVEGDATKDQTLRDAGIGRARGLAACLADDADNLFLSLTARGFRPDIPIVARAYDEESLQKLRRAGANHAISPTVTGAVRIASALLRPTVVSFLDAATLGSDIALRLEETQIPDGSPLVGQTLADAKIPQSTGLIVLALRSHEGNGRPIYNPGPDTKLHAHDTMIVLGNPEQVQRLRHYVAGEDVS